MTLKNVLFLLIFILALGTLFPSCYYYDKEETLYPFKDVIQRMSPILKQLSPSLAPAVMFAIVLGTCRVTFSSIPGPVSRSLLRTVNSPSIDHTGPFQMPKGGSMLDVCSIEKIKKMGGRRGPDN